VAREFRELGVHVNFAPDADVNTNPLNPVIHVRSFGEDPKKVAEKVLAYRRSWLWRMIGIIMCTTADMWLWFPERWKKMKVPLPTG
jgi:hypothetical protein